MLSIEHLVTLAQDQPAWVVVPVIVTALLGVYMLLNLLSASRNKKKTSSSAFPTYPHPPSTLPLLGNTLDAIYTQKDRLYDWMLEQHELHKRPWELAVIGYPLTIVVSTPEHFEDVLKTHFDVFPKDDSQCDIFSDVFGCGIVAVNGHAWHAQRKATSQLFTPQKIKESMYPVMQLKAQTLCAMMTKYEARGEPISLKRVLNHFSADVFAKGAFDVDLNCLENGVESDHENEFAYATRVASQVLQERFHEPLWLWRLKRALNIGQERVLKENIRHIDSLVYNILEAAIEKKKKSTSGEPAAEAAAKDLIAALLDTDNSKSELGGDLDAKTIRDMVVTFFMEGTDAAAQNMAFLVVMLNRCPRALAKIRQEIHTKFPGLAKGDLPSMEELGQLVYLEAAIRENLRLNPTAPASMRQADKDVVLSDGTFVAKGTRVILAFYAGMRSKAVWGDDANEFKPERWIDPATGTLIPDSPFRFASFSAGPRVCPGMRFALAEMKISMALLLSRFDLTTVEDPWKITYGIAITCGVKGPLMVNIASVAM